MNESSFAWDDPLLLDDQLTEDERMVFNTFERFAQERLMPVILDCLEHQCTLGEISSAMRDVFGRYQERIVI